MLTPAVQRIYQDVGKRVAEKRKALGMVQDDVAAALGLSRTSVTNIEIGRQRILLHQLFELADILDMDVAELLGLTETKVRRDILEIDPKMWPAFAGPRT